MWYTLGYDVNIYYPSTKFFFISRQLVTFYLHFFLLISRRFGSHMANFSHFVLKLKVIHYFCFTFKNLEVRVGDGKGKMLKCSLTFFTPSLSHSQSQAESRKLFPSFSIWIFKCFFFLQTLFSTLHLLIVLHCNLENFLWPWNCNGFCITYCIVGIHIMYALDCRTMPNTHTGQISINEKERKIV